MGKNLAEEEDKNSMGEVISLLLFRCACFASKIAFALLKGISPPRALPAVHPTVAGSSSNPSSSTAAIPLDAAADTPGSSKIEKRLFG
jgi:hypothetical protein